MYSCFGWCRTIFRACLQMINLHEMVLLKVKQDYADGKLENQVQNIVHNLNLDETNDIDEILYMIAEQRIDETR